MACSVIALQAIFYEKDTGKMYYRGDEKFEDLYPSVPIKEVLGRVPRTEQQKNDRLFAQVIIFWLVPLCGFFAWLGS